MSVRDETMGKITTPFNCVSLIETGSSKVILHHGDSVTLNRKIWYMKKKNENGFIIGYTIQKLLYVRVCVKCRRRRSN